jgi:hypothetical protein
MLALLFFVGWHELFWWGGGEDLYASRRIASRHINNIIFIFCLGSRGEGKQDAGEKVGDYALGTKKGANWVYDGCAHTFFAGFAVTAPTAFSASPLTLVATVVFFFGAAFFLVTPVGLLALVVVVLGALLAVVFALGLAFLVVVLVVVVSSTLGKTRGLEFPVAARVSLAIAIYFLVSRCLRAVLGGRAHSVNKDAKSKARNKLTDFLGTLLRNSIRFWIYGRECAVER